MVYSAVQLVRARGATGTGVRDVVAEADSYLKRSATARMCAAAAAQSCALTGEPGSPLSVVTWSANARNSRRACSRHARHVTSSGVVDVIAYGTRMPHPVVSSDGASTAAPNVDAITFR